MRERNLGRIFKRTAATMLVSSMGYLIPPDNTTHAQAPEASLNPPLGFLLPTRISSIDPMFVGFPTREEIPVTITEIGVSTDAEVNQLPYTQKEDLGNGMIRYTFPGQGRNNIIITQEGGVAQFKRKSIGASDDPIANVSKFDAYWGPVEGIGPAPDDYQIPGSSINIHIFASKGTTAVINETTGKVIEIQVYLPIPTVAGYNSQWPQGDYGE